jgi:hypothetical protein
LRFRRSRVDFMVGIGAAVFTNAIALVFLTLSLNASAPLRQVKSHSFAAGPATGPTIRSPLGREGIAWAAHVGRVESRGKARVFVSYCDASAFDGLLVDATPLGHWDTPTVSVRDTPARDARITLDLPIDGTDRMPVPDAMRSRCGPLPSDAYYQEAVVAPRQPLSVSGCRPAEGPGVLSPCGDDADFVSTFAAHVVIDRVRSEVAKNHLFALLAAFIGLAALMLVASYYRTLVDRTKENA